MPVRTIVEERYWCPGGWPWEWFRTCVRTVEKWCYDFNWVKEYRFLFFCYLEGCENGVKSTWFAGCFNLLGSETFFGVRKCFTNRLNENGQCG